MIFVILNLHVFYLQYLSVILIVFYNIVLDDKIMMCLFRKKRIERRLRKVTNDCEEKGVFGQEYPLLSYILPLCKITDCYPCQEIFILPRRGSEIFIRIGTSFDDKGERRTKFSRVFYNCLQE